MLGSLDAGDRNLSGERVNPSGAGSRRLGREGWFGGSTAQLELTQFAHDLGMLHTGLADGDAFADQTRPKEGD
jgi:hypothetical protein